MIVTMKKIFNPFGRISRQTMIIMITLQVIITLLLWHTASNGLIPTPGKVAMSFVELLSTKLLLDNLLVSLVLTLKAMVYSIGITLALAYLSVIPFFKSIASF